jgi:hypothetical protein
MMCVENNTSGEVGEERSTLPRCRYAIETDHPCPRPATERLWFEEGEPTLCPGHAMAARLSDQRDALTDALYKM